MRPVILVGLTGGIGSGKSTVCELLVDRGAIVIDSDAIVRDLQQPGAPLLSALAARFGDEIITPDGALDRQALADKVFPDPEAVKALNKIVHPAVGVETARLVMARVHTDAVVVIDIPLLEEERWYLQATIVVDVPVDVQVERLVRFRHFSETDARARIDRQVSRQRRLELATFVIDNSGEPGGLAAQVDEVWTALLALPHLPVDFDITAKDPKAAPA